MHTNEKEEEILGLLHELIRELRCGLTKLDEPAGVDALREEMALFRDDLIRLADDYEQLVATESSEKHVVCQGLRRSHANPMLQALMSY